MREYGPWKIRETREIYEDPWIQLRRDEVIRPDGAPGHYSVVRIKPGVTVLALDDQGQAHLTEEFHYAVGRTTLECVSGGRDGDESPQVAAERELAEELGITAADWTDLGVCDPFTASVLSPTHLFLASKLTFGEPSPEGVEVIRHVTIPLGEAVRKVLSSQITHAPSCLAILKSAVAVGKLNVG